MGAGRLEINRLVKFKWYLLVWDLRNVGVSIDPKESSAFEVPISLAHELDAEYSGACMQRVDATQGYENDEIRILVCDEEPGWVGAKL